MEAQVTIESPLTITMIMYVVMLIQIFVGDLDKRRSTSGYVFTLTGGAISWMSNIQDTVALSTT